MLRKRRSAHTIKMPEGELNIVPLMDVLTILIFFLLLGTSFASYSVVQATPLLSGEPSQEKKPTFVLKLGIERDLEAEVWLGPIHELKMVQAAELKAYLGRRFSGNPQAGYSMKLSARDKDGFRRELQDILVALKKSFPHENKVVVAFADKIGYQRMIDVVSSVRELASEREGFVLINLLGKQEKTRVLFPEVIMSEWSEGA
ncbi:MAG: biopolymer transporter ExbD [Bdellovibrionota bacterium]